VSDARNWAGTLTRPLRSSRFRCVPMKSDISAPARPSSPVVL
jgi:hypothetical protein